MILVKISLVAYVVINLIEIRIYELTIRVCAEKYLKLHVRLKLFARNKIKTRQVKI